jgi:putative hydrolase of the HAD superfamily
MLRSYLRGYEAMLFDLNDTLLDRNKAVDKLLLIILEKYYEGVKKKFSKKRNVTEIQGI